jgi:uncharacterized protein (TIGR03382 family)
MRLEVSTDTPRCTVSLSVQPDHLCVQINGGDAIALRTDDERREAATAIAASTGMPAAAALGMLELVAGLGHRIPR